jgi:hypothetical protein
MNATWCAKAAAHSCRPMCADIILACRLPWAPWSTATSASLTPCSRTVCHSLLHPTPQSSFSPPPRPMCSVASLLMFRGFHSNLRLHFPPLLLQRRDDRLCSLQGDCKRALCPRLRHLSLTSLRAAREPQEAAPRLHRHALS